MLPRAYSQKMDEDYEETFSPTASLMSIRVVMQKAAQEDLILHQMDVKTAYSIPSLHQVSPPHSPLD